MGKDKNLENNQDAFRCYDPPASASQAQEQPDQWQKTERSERTQEKGEAQQTNAR